jgi:hypothetical protein
MPSYHTYHKSSTDSAESASSVPVITAETLSVIVPSGRFSVSSIHVWGGTHDIALEPSDWVEFLTLTPMASARDGIVHMSQNAAWKEKLATSNA